MYERCHMNDQIPNASNKKCFNAKSLYRYYKTRKNTPKIRLGVYRETANSIEKGYNRREDNSEMHGNNSIEVVIASGGSLTQKGKNLR